MKCVRVITLRGEIGVVPLAPHRDLADWWEHFRGVGQIIGDKWGCPFEAIDFAKIVDLPEPPQPPQPPQADREVDELAKALAQGPVSYNPWPVA